MWRHPYVNATWRMSNRHGSYGFPWWRHQMDTFSMLLALCAGNSLVTGEFPSQRPVTRSSGVFLDLRLNKRLSKQSRGWWFEMPSRSLGRRCNEWNIIFGNLPCVLEHCHCTDYPMLLFSNLLVPNLPFSGGELTKSQDTGGSFY